MPKRVEREPRGNLTASPQERSEGTHKRIQDKDKLTRREAQTKCNTDRLQGIQRELRKTPEGTHTQARREPRTYPDGVQTESGESRKNPVRSQMGPRGNLKEIQTKTQRDERESDTERVRYRRGILTEYTTETPGGISRGSSKTPDRTWRRPRRTPGGNTEGLQGCSQGTPRGRQRDSRGAPEGPQLRRQLQRKSSGKFTESPKEIQYRENQPKREPQTVSRRKPQRIPRGTPGRGPRGTPTPEATTKKMHWQIPREPNGHPI